MIYTKVHQQRKFHNNRIGKVKKKKREKKREKEKKRKEKKRKEKKRKEKKSLHSLREEK